MFYSHPTNPTLDRQQLVNLADERGLAPPDWPRWLTLTKDGETVGTIPLTTILMGRGESGRGLERREVKLLGAMLNKARLHPSDCAWVHDWDEVRAAGIGYVVSVGEQGLKAWHEYGLVRVNMHGSTFVHVDGHGDRFCVMPLQHPGGVFQQTAWGFGVKEDMQKDLLLWRDVIEGRMDPQRLRGIMCVKCLTARVAKGKEPVRRRAEHWVDELDGVGLCDDHWRKRAQIVKKVRVKKRVDKSSVEAQIKGQGVMV